MLRHGVEKLANDVHAEEGRELVLLGQGDLIPVWSRGTIELATNMTGHDSCSASRTPDRVPESLLAALDIMETRQQEGRLQPEGPHVGLNEQIGGLPT